jgi:hypothetical protein
MRHKQGKNKNIAGSQEWHSGPELPYPISGSSMVEDPHGGVVLSGGVVFNQRASPTHQIEDTLFQLPNGRGKDAVWREMEQKMTIGRYLHTVFLVPDNIVDCSYF